MTYIDVGSSNRFLASLFKVFPKPGCFVKRSTRGAKMPRAVHLGFDEYHHHWLTLYGDGLICTAVQIGVNTQCQHDQAAVQDVHGPANLGNGHPSRDDFFIR